MSDQMTEAMKARAALAKRTFERTPHPGMDDPEPAPTPSGPAADDAVERLEERVNYLERRLSGSTRYEGMPENHPTMLAASELAALREVLRRLREADFALSGFSDWLHDFAAATKDAQVLQRGLHGNASPAIETQIRVLENAQKKLDSLRAEAAARSRGGAYRSGCNCVLPGDGETGSVLCAVRRQLVGGVCGCGCHKHADPSGGPRR